MGSDAQSKIDAFIDSRPAWQSELMRALRGWAHDLSDPVEESYRWGAPHFDHNGIMFGMMAFKKHVNLFFHKGALIENTHGLFEEIDREKGSRSVKFVEGDIANEKKIKSLFEQALAINRSGKKLTAAKPARKQVRTPPLLNSRLKDTPQALKVWKTLPPSHKREYIEWIVEAKKEETKNRRLEKTIAMLLDGKGLNDEYR